ncbi:MAG: flagellar basal body rod C-terminal domain-containing protein, partial [Methylococcaceae bacterium]|nr:flagellar basal body rod C-terminal domain-containing protein [Methylococcaceae bacterium]
DIATVTNVGSTISGTARVCVITKSAEGLESTLTALKINLEDQLSSINLHGIDNIVIDQNKIILNGKDNKVDIDSGASINITEKTYTQTFATNLETTLGLLKTQVDGDAHVTSSSISEGQLTLNGIVAGDDVNAQAFVFKNSTLQATAASVTGDSSADPVEVASEVFDFSGLALGGSAKLTLNGTDYSQAFHTDITTTLNALAQKISINQVLNDTPTLTMVTGSNGLLTLTGLSDGTQITATAQLTTRVELTETAASVTGKSSTTSTNRPDPRHFLGLSGGLNEDLLVFVTGSGGAKISGQWDKSPLIDHREAWRQDITVKFNSDGSQFELIDTETDTSLAHVNYNAEKGITYNGWSAELSSDPAGNDVFYIKGNHDLTGDNRNILKMAALQNDSTIFGGRGDFGEVYTSTVGKLGSVLVQTDIAREAQQTLVDQATEARDSVSGVSLDEEAANLLRFQQAYQASAQVVKIANTLFDSILSIR